MVPQVVAHRGASEVEAEHTLAAYVTALDDGADGVECDVRLTADGHLVCVHDRDLRRTANKRGLISTMTLTDLAELDFAAWKNPWADLDDEAPDREEGLGRVLTLRTLLETVGDYERRVEVAIEAKHPTRYAGLVEKRIVELLHDVGWDTVGTPARVMSFSHTALQRVERLAPEVPLVLLIERASRWPVVRPFLGDRWLLGPGMEMLREHPRLARRLADTGRDVHAWVVNTEDDLEKCLELGVAAVISDRPAYMVELLHR